MNKSYNSDIIFVILLTFLCMIFVITPLLNENPIKIIFELFLILFLPGYSLMALIFPKKDDLGIVERIALSFGLSVVLFPLMIFILNYTPFGINPIPIILTISAFIIILSIFTYIRRLKFPSEELFKVEFHKIFKKFTKYLRGASQTEKFLSIILIISIVIAIPMTALVITKPKNSEKFTEFYILGSNGKANNYPTSLTVGQTGNVIINIINHEHTTTNYNLIVKLNNKTIKDENITVLDNETFEMPFSFTISQSSQNQELEFLLYKIPDNSNVYRSLRLWINT